MFIETLKNIVVTLVTVLIFISAVELIAPNKMKKYIKFILGLILIATILNPILQFVSNDGKNVINSIKNYEELFSNDKDNTNFNSIETLKSSELVDARKKAFITNFNKNCNDLLENKFKNTSFKTEVDCDVDFNNITINVKRLKVGVKDNRISKVQRVVINNDENKNTQEENKEFTEIVDFINQELNIPKEKIAVYELGE